MIDEFEHFEIGKALFLPCHSCGPEHNLIAESFVEIFDSTVRILDTSAIDFYYQIVPAPWFQRLKNAVRILLGIKVKAYETIDINPEYIEKLRDYLNEFLDRHAEIFKQAEEAHARNKS